MNFNNSVYDHRMYVVNNNWDHTLQGIQMNRNNRIDTSKRGKNRIDVTNGNKMYH